MITGIAQTGPYQLFYLSINHLGKHKFISREMLIFDIHIEIICSPTYPGEFDPSESIYTLNYPVGFFLSSLRSTSRNSTQLCFRVSRLLFLYLLDIRSFIHLQQVRGTRYRVLLPQNSWTSTYALELPLEFPDGTTPIASHVYVYNGSQNWRHATLPPLSKFIGETNAAAHGRYGKKGRREVDRIIAEVSRHAKKCRAHSLWAKAKSPFLAYCGRYIAFSNGRRCSCYSWLA